MTKKQQRDLVFNKYNGLCAYCGTELQKGWHIDEIEPVRRNRKWIPPQFVHKVTGLPRDKKSEITDDYEWREGKWVSDGCMHPERFNLDNQMPACASCNINKHSLGLEEFRKLIQGFMKHLNEVSTQYKIAKRYGLVTETIKPVVFFFERVGKRDQVDGLELSAESGLCFCIHSGFYDRLERENNKCNCCKKPIRRTVGVG